MYKMIRNILLILLLTVHPLFAQQRARWVVKPKYDQVSAFSEGVAAVKLNGKWGYVSEGGMEILPAAYEMAYPFGEETGVLATEDNTLVAIVDKTGRVTTVREKLKIDSRFAVFSDGLLLVSNGRKWGYLNKSGALAIECKYAGAQPFSEGLAAVLFSQYWYYIAADGSTKVSPSDRREIYWAMGFYDGKAVVLYKNGMGYIDKDGRELSDRFPAMTPPPDAESYKGESLVCREGVLHFDAKSRATSFVNTKGNVTRFVPEVRDDSRVEIRKAGSGFGIVAFDNALVAGISLSADTLASVFGHPATLGYTVTNVSPSDIESLEIRINEQLMPGAVSVAAGGRQDFSLTLDKTNDEDTERVDLRFALSEYGLPIGEYAAAVVLKDIPALRIDIPGEPVSVRNGETSYALGIQLVNMSSVPVSQVSVSVGNQNRIVDLRGGESLTLPFNIPVSSQTVNVIARPPRTPFVSASRRMTVRRIERPLELPPDTIGLSKQIITK
jgi:hypothetical protein